MSRDRPESILLERSMNVRFFHARGREILKLALAAADSRNSSLSVIVSLSLSEVARPP